MTDPGIGSLQERIAALEQADTFSSAKRAMLALVESGDTKALEALLPHLLRTDNEQLLGLVGRAALLQWGESVLSRIELRDVPDEEKGNALQLCRWDGGDLAQALLAEGLQEPSADVRLTAACLIGELPHRTPRMLEALRKVAVSDEDITVRRAAARSLAAGNDPEAIPVLERILTETGDDKVEDILIDLRLRVIERLHPGLIPPREECERQSSGVQPPLRTMGRFEYSAHRAADAIREVLITARAVAMNGVRDVRAGRGVSAWRLGACIAACALLAFATLHFAGAYRKVHPRPERTAFVCPVCGNRSEAILGPGARCNFCGDPVFADREAAPRVASFPREDLE